MGPQRGEGPGHGHRGPLFLIKSFCPVDGLLQGNIPLFWGPSPLLYGPKVAIERVFYQAQRLVATCAPSFLSPSGLSGRTAERLQAGMGRGETGASQRRGTAATAVAPRAFLTSRRAKDMFRDSDHVERVVAKASAGARATAAAGGGRGGSNYGDARSSVMDAPRPSVLGQGKKGGASGGRCISRRHLPQHHQLFF